MLRAQRVACVLVAGLAFVLQIGDGLSGAAAYVLTVGQAESNPLANVIVALGGVSALFWVKAALIAGVTGLMVRMPVRYGLALAACLAAAGLYGTLTNLQNLGHQVDVPYWLDLLHSAP